MWEYRKAMFNCGHCPHSKPKLDDDGFMVYVCEKIEGKPIVDLLGVLKKCPLDNKGSDACHT